jgi:apolipoprotein N-acyltransferase
VISRLFGHVMHHVAARQGWRAGATALGLGVLAAAALPPVHAVPVLLLAVPGLLVLIGAAPGARAAAWRGVAFGLGHHMAGLYWITEAVLVEAARFFWLVPIAVPFVAFVLALFLAPVAVAAWWAPPGWPRLLVFAGAWTLAELARGIMFTGFPWNLMGSVWAFDAIALQGAAYVGVHGLSLATMLLAGLPLMAGRRPVAMGGGAVVLAGVLGVARLLAAEPAPHPVALRIVQGNVPQGQKWSDGLRAQHFRRHLALTANAAPAGPGETTVVVWPETASPYLLATDAVAREAAASVLPEGGLLLAGTVRVERPPFQAFNSLVGLDHLGELRAVFDKAHLVPFGEYVPLRAWLPLETIVRGNVDFSAGPGPRSIDPGVAGVPPFSPLICYEIIFSGRVVARDAPRPQWLLNVTNDAWFGNSAGPRQHLAAARLRAVEEGLPVVRAANTGISAVFDSRGREVARLGLGVTGSIAAPLPAVWGATLFSHTGVWGPTLLAFVVTGLGACLARRGQPPGRVAHK